MTILPALLLASVLSSSPTSVLVLPLHCTSEVPADTCRMLTEALVFECGRVEGFRVVSLKEVEGALGTEMRRQMMDCDDASCAAEIAGAANTDEIVMGSVGMVGHVLMLTATRVRARDAGVEARGMRQVKDGLTESLLPEMPALAEELFGRRQTPVAAPPAKAGSDERTVRKSVKRTFRTDEPPPPPTRISIRALLEDGESPRDIYDAHAVRFEGTNAWLGHAKVDRHPFIQRIAGYLSLRDEVRGYLGAIPEATDELPGAGFRIAHAIAFFFMALLLVLGFLVLIAIPVSLLVLFAAAGFAVAVVILNFRTMAMEENAARVFNERLQEMIDEESASLGR